MKTPELRTAAFAIVIAGPDGVIDDDPSNPLLIPDSANNKDNIVEFGQ